MISWFLIHAMPALIKGIGRAYNDHDLQEESIELSKMTKVQMAQLMSFRANNAMVLECCQRIERFLERTKDLEIK